MQGLTVGALVHDMPVVDGRYAGGPLGWLTPFALLCGVGLCLGYSLLGAAWLIQKCEGEIRKIAYRQITWLALGVLVFLIVVFAYALADHLRIIDRWLERPYLFIFPVIGALAAGVLGASIRRHWDGLPFTMVVLIFLAAFGTLTISFWPYMIPFAITIDEGAAPPSSLAFMMWGEGLFVFPLMLIYNVIAYSVFRGKVRASTHHY
jgi:cytochrome d ubiquinol oxidase subunit II